MLTRPRTLASIIGALLLLSLAAAPAHAAPSSTSITFTSPGYATLGSYNTLVIEVGASDGTTQPVGSVQVRNAAGQLVGTAATSRGGSISSAVATVPWVPTEQTTYGFTATYVPDNSALLSGSTTSTTFSVIATPSGQPVWVAAPQMYLGIPATMTATVYPSTLPGSVGFIANGTGLGPSQAMTTGSTSFTFMPGSLGWQEFGVTFTSTSRPLVQGVSTQWVKVLPPVGTDSTTLASLPASLANGQGTTLDPVTVTGRPAAVSASGPCTLMGLTLTATSGSGACTVTTVTDSDPATGYLGATQEWSVPVVPGTQTAPITAPDSGKLTAGAPVRLSARNARTNADQPIRWEVSAGAEHCRLATTSRFVTLVAESTGRCRVVASAAEVPGAWQALRVTRSYRVG